MTERIRVGVVGGGIGRQHLDAYAKLGDRYEIVAFCDIDRGKAEETAAKYAIPWTTASYDELLSRPEIDLVDVCTPSGLHFAQTRQALQAGKHVICEKPLAASLAEIDELAGLELESGRRICPIFQYRFGHGLEKLRHLRDKGVLGKTYLTTIETHWKRGSAYYGVPWRGKWATELGGCLVTHAIHAHDMLVHAVGPIRSVHARTQTRVNPIETDDTAVLSLEMADGSFAASSVTMGAAVEHSRLRFYFEQASFESELAPYRPHLEPWKIMPMSEDAAGRIDEALADFVPGCEHFEGQVDRLHKALIEGAPLPVTLADARTSIELLTAAYWSARNHVEVPLPIDADHPYYHGWQPAHV
jgi:predicted dehydrogenase